MTPPDDGILFAPIGAAGLEALLARDLPEASRLTGFDLPDEYLDSGWLWQLRLDQLAQAPGDEPWVAWVVARATDRVVIGQSGFHGGPDDDGMVELSYAVLPEFRRRGYATAIVQALVELARAHPHVRVLRAAISPENSASLATLAKFPFAYVGEQIDEIDGRELVYEMSVV